MKERGSERGKDSIEYWGGDILCHKVTRQKEATSPSFREGEKGRVREGKGGPIRSSREKGMHKKEKGPDATMAGKKKWDCCDQGEKQVLSASEWFEGEEKGEKGNLSDRPKGKNQTRRGGKYYA